MTMTTRTQKKYNKNVKNVKQAAFIQYKLKENGMKQSLIASELGISNSAVSRALNGLSTISKVAEWLEDNIGVSI